MKHKLTRSFLLLLLPAMLFTGCGQKPDLDAEKKKLLALHKEQQDAHLDENAQQFVAQFADSMLSVNKGIISITTKDSALKRFNKYFARVQFKKWEDVKPPIIEFSADASMAYMLVDKEVILTYINEENKEVEETTHYAWISVFKKQANGEWKIACNASTNEPVIIK